MENQIKGPPFFRMVSDITFIGGEAGKAQFGYASAETFANLFIDLAKAGPAKPELRQVMLQKFQAFKIRHF